MRGLTKCHHMAATLIYAHHNISGTDKSCKWKQRKEDLEAKFVTIDDMFTSPEKQNFRAATSFTDESKKKLYESLKESVGHHVAF